MIPNVIDQIAAGPKTNSRGEFARKEPTDQFDKVFSALGNESKPRQNGWSDSSETSVDAPLDEAKTEPGVVATTDNGEPETDAERDMSQSSEMAEDEPDLLPRSGQASVAEASASEGDMSQSETLAKMDAEAAAKSASEETRRSEGAEMRISEASRAEEADSKRRAIAEAPFGSIVAESRVTNRPAVTARDLAHPGSAPKSSSILDRSLPAVQPSSDVSRLSPNGSNASVHDEVSVSAILGAKSTGLPESAGRDGKTAISGMREQMGIRSVSAAHGHAGVGPAVLGVENSMQIHAEMKESRAPSIVAGQSRLETLMRSHLLGDGTAPGAEAPKVPGQSPATGEGLKTSAESGKIAVSMMPGDAEATSAKGSEGATPGREPSLRQQEVGYANLRANVSALQADADGSAQAAAGVSKGAELKEQSRFMERSAERREARETGLAPRSSNRTSSETTPSSPPKPAAAPLLAQSTIGAPLFVEEMGERTRDADGFAVPNELRSTHLASQPAAIHVARTDHANSVMRQIVEVTGQLQDGPVEVSLNPEELGRVRMQMTTSDQGLVMHITSERPETLDLLRRHIDQLHRELSELGYARVDFTFGERGQQSRSGAGEVPQSRSGSAESTESGSPASQRQSLSPTPLAREGLDIRL